MEKKQTLGSYGLGQPMGWVEFVGLGFVKWTHVHV